MDELPTTVNQKVGFRLSDFKILKELGKGSYGTVFKVESYLDKNVYVMKKLELSHMKEKHQKECFREVQLLRKVNHPNIIKYYASFLEKDILYIIMEYAECGDLYALIKHYKKHNKFIDETDIWKIAHEVLQGLDYLHKNNIIHRDIKCLNLFITRDKHIKIGDLGVSTIVNDINGLHCTRVGTPLYLSPELVKQVPYDYKVDIWSCGCSLYHLANLEPPFLGDNLIVLGNNIVKGKQKVLPQGYSKELNEFIDKMLMKRPEKRPTAREAMEMIPLMMMEKIKSDKINNVVIKPRPFSSVGNRIITYNKEEILPDKKEEILNKKGNKNEDALLPIKEEDKKSEKTEKEVAKKPEEKRGKNEDLEDKKEIKELKEEKLFEKKGFKDKDKDKDISIRKKKNENIIICAENQSNENKIAKVFQDYNNISGKNINPNSNKRMITSFQGKQNLNNNNVNEIVKTEANNIEIKEKNTFRVKINKKDKSKIASNGEINQFLIPSLLTPGDIKLKNEELFAKRARDNPTKLLDISTKSTRQNYKKEKFSQVGIIGYNSTRNERQNITNIKSSFSKGSSSSEIKFPELSKKSLVFKESSNAEQLTKTPQIEVKNDNNNPEIYLKKNRIFSAKPSKIASKIANRPFTSTGNRVFSNASSVHSNVHSRPLTALNRGKMGNNIINININFYNIDMNKRFLDPSLKKMNREIIEGNDSTNQWDIDFEQKHNSKDVMKKHFSQCEDANEFIFDKLIKTLEYSKTGKKKLSVKDLTAKE